MTIKDFAAAIRKAKTPLPADPFDTDKFPFGKHAGDNKFGFLSCPTCGKVSTQVPPQYSNAMPRGAFLFRDQLSAKEYYISGMCQACQDSIFGRDE